MVNQQEPEGRFDSEDELDVVAVFPTIQGEGPYAGRPAMFVRLAGCVLRCAWCDTNYTTRRERYKIQTLMGMVEDAWRYPGSRLLVITGGEPFRQNLRPFVEMATRFFGWQVQIETSGSAAADLWVMENASVVCSPKTGRVQDAMVKAAAWKYIVRGGEVDAADGLPVMSTQVLGKRQRIARPTNQAPVFVQPCDEGDAEATHLNTVETAAIAIKFGYRLSIQLHKIVGLP